METAQSKPPAWKPFLILAAAVLLGGFAVYFAPSLLGLDRSQSSNTREIKPLQFVVEGGLSLLISVLFLFFVLRNQGKNLFRALGFRPTSLSWKDYILVLMGGEFVFAIGVSLAAVSAWLLKFNPSEIIPYSEMNLVVGMTFVLLVSLGPGFGEEILFRGYLQAAWLQRFRPWTAIVLTSVAFGLMHGSVPRDLMATSIGIWLGVLAWRTGSIWPSIWSHTFINGSWNLYMILRSSSPNDSAEEVDWGIMSGFTAVSFVAFLFALRLLKRTRPIESTS